MLWIFILFISRYLNLHAVRVVCHNLYMESLILKTSIAYRYNSEEWKMSIEEEMRVENLGLLYHVNKDIIDNQMAC